ncbi:hypothetical protein [Streptantibioticus silvisoli]|nr:hypothetical protein [Streptantibioticus silvisoli]
MGREQIRGIVAALGGLLNVLRKAAPEGEAEVYHELGPILIYDHET